METANGSSGICGPSVLSVSLASCKIPNLVGLQTSKSQKTISCGIGLIYVYETHFIGY